jgi:hypothetical protein
MSWDEEFKSENRMTKSERNPKREIQMASAARAAQSISEFGLLSDFGFRASDF